MSDLNALGYSINGKPFSLTERDIERFWRHIDKGPGCWLWYHPTGTVGYGQFHVAQGGICQAHRVSYVIAYGAVPPGKIVMHRCDTPQCVRPDHLQLGTRSENQQDAAAKRRAGLLPPWGWIGRFSAWRAAQKLTA